MEIGKMKLAGKKGKKAIHKTVLTVGIPIKKARKKTANPDSIC